VACSQNSVEERYICDFVDIAGKGVHLEDLGLEGITKIKWIFKNYEGSA